VTSDRSGSTQPESRSTWKAPDLDGRVAVVTGGSRGVGLGIAEVLAECGAEVFVVGRGAADDGDRPGPALAEAVSRIRDSGHRAVAAPADLANPDAIRKVMVRVEAEHGRLDLVVNNAVGWSSGADADNPWISQPPWHAPVWWWDENFTVGVRSHYLVTNAAAPLLFRSQAGLVVFTSERKPESPGLQELVLDLRATAVERINQVMALHLRPRGVSSVLLYPGFTRTEAVSRSFRDRRGQFASWTDEEFLHRTASPQYAGRAVAALWGDPDVVERTGTTLSAHEAARAYGFTDVTGLVPDPV
jgi:NAD(P)-dependent dehydrogenase (short-subunit alcohol dehydrogenase family)